MHKYSDLHLLQHKYFYTLPQLNLSFHTEYHWYLDIRPPQYIYIFPVSFPAQKHHLAVFSHLKANLKNPSHYLPSKFHHTSDKSRQKAYLQKFSYQFPAPAP